MDDRHDLYGDQFFKNYLKVVFVQPEWSEVLEEEHADWVLVEKNSSLGTMLGLTSGGNPCTRMRRRSYFTVTPSRTV